MKNNSVHLDKPTETSADTSAHTALPWVAKQEFANRWRIEYQREGFLPLSVAIVCTTVLEVGVNNKHTAANAAFIVRAVNERDDLVKALAFLLELNVEQAIAAEADQEPYEYRSSREAYLLAQLTQARAALTKAQSGINPKS